MDIQREFLKEKTPHGDMMFPLMVHHYSGSYTGSMVIHPHWHKEYELLLAEAGTALFSVGDRRFDVAQGDIVFIRSGQLHSASVTSKDSFSFTAVVFDEALLAGRTDDDIELDYIDAVKNGQIVFPVLIERGGTGSSMITADIKTIIRSFEKKTDAYKLRIKSLLFDIWYRLSSHPSSTIEPGRSGSGSITLVKSVMTYIQNNCTDDITLDILSKKFGISEGYLCRLFRRSVNMSVIDYLSSCRIQKAAQMLLTTTSSVSEISADCGYSNISYFNKVFRRLMHRTPTEYRKAQ